MALACLTGAAAGVLPITPAAAQAFKISPVTMTLGPGEQTTTLTVGIDEGPPIGIQARAFLWTQENGKNVLTPTHDLVVSPPVGTLSPGVDQIIRVVSRAPAQETEKTYRIWVDQLPRPGEPGTIKINIRVSLPVFLTPPGITRPRLSAQLVPQGNSWVVQVHNAGQRHGRLLNAVITGGHQPPTSLTPKMLYILAGSTMTLEAPPGALPTASRLVLSATSENGPIKIPLTQQGGN